MSWFAGSLAIWVCAATEMSEVFERMWHPFTYFMLPICGLGFMVDWLPIKYQKLALMVPMVNGCEMLRDGYFGKAVHCHYSVLYLTVWCLCLMVAGLSLLKVFARTAEPQ
jgi:capsular polysaccharide transport system permease protein